MLHRDSLSFDFGAGSSFSETPSALGTDSTLCDLPLHNARLALSTSGAAAAHLFDQSPELPGILLTDLTGQDSAIKVLSRSRFLECLLRPKGCDLFLSEPLSVLYSYARLKPLTLAAETPILVAARVALRRPTELQGEPILVKATTGDRLLNAHDLNKAHWQIRGIETQVRYERAQAAMLQTQKMAALGRLVDGVSHEILDPLSFIWGNLTHVSRYCQQLLELIEAYEQDLPITAQSAELIDLKDAIELEYLQADLPETITSIQSGAERLKQLATSLQNFCHIDEVYPKPADLHSLIDSIVLLLKSRLTTQIQVTRHYAALPPLPCFAGQLSQVFMNILTQCIDSLLSQAARHHVAADMELRGSDECAIAQTAAPHIHITTTLSSGPESQNSPYDRWVTITVADNGPGFSAAALQDIMRSFSVQQRLERETDLAVSYRIITAKHGGHFSVRSPLAPNQTDGPNAGTEFKIQLPLYDPSTPT